MTRNEIIVAIIWAIVVVIVSVIVLATWGVGQ